MGTARLFALWAHKNLDLFSFLEPCERVCGEWLARAHGTRYRLAHAPFVAFDIMRRGRDRVCSVELCERIGDLLLLPKLLGEGTMTIEKALGHLGDYGHHGALDPVEGAVWRVEREGRVDFLANYVRPEKNDGI